MLEGKVTAEYMRDYIIKHGWVCYVVCQTIEGPFLFCFCLCRCVFVCVLLFLFGVPPGSIAFILETGSKRINLPEDIFQLALARGANDYYQKIVTLMLETTGKVWSTLYIKNGRDRGSERWVDR